MSARPLSFQDRVGHLDLGGVDIDDRYEVLPDDLYIELEIKSCELIGPEDARHTGDDRAAYLQTRLQVTFPQEHAGAMLRDRVTMPDELLHGDKFNPIAKRFKMFCDAAEKLSEDGQRCTAADASEFEGEIVASRTKNKTQQYVNEAGKPVTKTYTNLVFEFHKATKTPGIQPSGESVATPDVRWAPQ